MTFVKVTWLSLIFCSKWEDSISKYCFLELSIKRVSWGSENEGVIKICFGNQSFRNFIKLHLLSYTDIAFVRKKKTALELSENLTYG